MAGCLSIEEIERALTALDDDPHRLHLEECPRCAALAAELRVFLDSDDSHDTDLPPGSNTDDADARLSSFVAGEILAGRSQEIEKGETTRNRFSLSNVARLSDRRTGALLVAAVLLLLVFGFYQIREHWGTSSDRVMRGEDEMADYGLLLEVKPDGSCSFSWHEVTGAQSYLLLVYAEDLSELGRYNCGNVTNIGFESAGEILPEGAAFWRIIGILPGSAQVPSKLTPVAATLD
ncbi:MAG: hypothetical protein GY835_20435 [bacterium]|nr:hypothetical protein [bacterium]